MQCKQNSEMATRCTCLLQNCSLNSKPKKLLSFQAIRLGSLNREYSNIKIDPSHQHQNMVSNRNMMLVANAHCTTMHTDYPLHFGMYFEHEISLFCGHFLMCCFSILLLHICFLSRPDDSASIKFMVKLWSILII